MDLNHHMTDMSSILEDRILWFDGQSSFTPENIKTGILYNVPVLFSTIIDDDINKFNALSDEKISIKTTCEVPKPELCIPDEYKNMDVLNYILSKIDRNLDNYQEVVSRINLEYSIFKRKNYIDQLRTCIYIVDQFNTNNVVWGTGRGSACCSYILYVIGIHDVDSILYDLDINEFLR